MKETLENKIRKNLIKKFGISNAEASAEAFAYVTAWMDGEIDPETIADVAGVSVKDL